MYHITKKEAFFATGSSPVESCMCVCLCVCVCVLSYSVVTDFYTSMNCGLPGFSVQCIFQARILDWVDISYSMVITYNEQCRIADCRRRFSFGTRDQT